VARRPCPGAEGSAAFRLGERRRSRHSGAAHIGTIQGGGPRDDDEGRRVRDQPGGRERGAVHRAPRLHPLQLIRPEWSSRACEDKIQSAATRRALIERYVDTDTLIAPAHFASPSIGRIVSSRGSFAYRLNV
jgi:hypothetical protein